MASTVGSPRVTERPAALVAVDRLGTPLGRVRRLTPDGGWAVVEAGAIIRRTSVVPLDGCRVEGEAVVVAATASTVWTAPRTKVWPGRDLSHEHRVKLLRHYGL